jgi:hypothetical protein
VREKKFMNSAMLCRGKRADGRKGRRKRSQYGQVEKVRLTAAASRVWSTAATLYGCLYRHRTLLPVPTTFIPLNIRTT